MLADAGSQVLQGALHLQLGSAAVAPAAPKPEGTVQVLSHRLKVLLAVKAGAKDFETAHLVHCIGRSKQNVATQLAPHASHGATATLSGDTDPVLHAVHVVAVPPKFLAHLVHASAALLLHAVQATLQSAAQDVIVCLAAATNLALGHSVQVPVIDAVAPTVVTAAEIKVQKCVYSQLAHKVSAKAPPVLQAPHPVAVVPQVICCVPMMREDTRMIKEIIFRSFFMKKCFYNYNQELIIAYVNYGSLRFISWWRLIGYIIRP